MKLCDLCYICLEGARDTGGLKLFDPPCLLGFDFHFTCMNCAGCLCGDRDSGLLTKASRIRPTAFTARVTGSLDKHKKTFQSSNILIPVAFHRRDLSTKGTGGFVQRRYSAASGPVTWQELGILSNQHFAIHHARLGCDFTFVCLLLKRSLPRAIASSGAERETQTSYRCQQDRACRVHKYR